MMMAYFFVSLLSMLSISSVVSKRSKSSSKSDATKQSNVVDINKILKAKFLSQAVVSLTDSNFSKFINQKSRDYTAILMFTAIGPKYECEVCGRGAQVFSEVANYYHTQYDFNSSKINERLAFFMMDVDTARGTFQKMDIQHVPRFFVYSVNSDGAQSAPGEFDVQRAMEGPDSLIKTIGEITKVKVCYRFINLSSLVSSVR